MSLNASRNYARRRTSVLTSGSARRRATRRRAAEATRFECERQARDKHEAAHRDKSEQRRQAREELGMYEPWGRPGGGAPNPAALRFTDPRRRHLYPEDELKRMADVNVTTWQWPVRRRRGPHRVHEDSQLRFQYDELVASKKKEMREVIKRDTELENKLKRMRGPWGRPGPGGAVWRNPRNVGLNFHNSMGWTDEKIFEQINTDHVREKRSSLVLPDIGKSLSVPKTNTNNKPSDITKLPDINNKSYSDSKVDEGRVRKSKPCIKIRGTKKEKHDKQKPTKSKTKETKKCRKDAEVKETEVGQTTKKTTVDDDKIEDSLKPTPDSTILRMTGGVELVPLLARRRRVGARTLPSSDVTRPPEDPCQWRDLLCDRYLQELKHQMQAKCQQKEECQRTSAEDCRRHHATWAALWGRPGHGAPLPGRVCRYNLTNLLYLAPLHPAA